MTIEEIKEDLKDVRYYYSRISAFGEAEQVIGTSSIVEKIKRYNEAVRDAPPRLYDVYNGLYVNNFTQEGLAFEMGYTSVYIQKLNKDLLTFLKEKFEVKK